MTSSAKDTVFTRLYSGDELPPADRREILRYMGGKAEDPAVLSLIEECEAEALSQLSYKVCYCRSDLSFFPAESRDLAKNLSGCCAAFIFAATVGLGIDRLIARYGRVSPLKALCFQAIGAERIECLCNFFNDEIKRELAERGFSLRPRFSPGYGDLPLSFQREIFSRLDCWRKIGLSLSDSLLMSPSKSVTAVIGLATQGAGAQADNPCLSCAKADCIFRR